ncbi:MAG: hypothetical protein BWX51_01225 [Bacteroidetes bacterium ADurb.Bin012]|nr:MAG: hypothetical protein BWX51_01225 [Bacteroidetes bacterium ADurb.Bin012]
MPCVYLKILRFYSNNLIGPMILNYVLLIQY